MTLKEIQSLAIRERIDINLHSSAFADRPWCLITSRRSGEGEIKITLYGRDIEELLARGVEAVSGISLPKQFTRFPSHIEEIEKPMVKWDNSPVFIDDIPF